MKRFLSLAFTILLALTAAAQSVFDGDYTNEELKINVHLDLTAENLTVPGLEFLGPVGGYIDGRGIYGNWMLISYKVENEKTVTRRFSNELGSDSQNVKMTQIDGTTYHFKTTGGNALKKAVNRKLVKIASEFDLKKDNSDK